MEAVLTQEMFQNAVDRALQDVVPKVTGISLLQGGPPPKGEIYTVHTVFEGTKQAGLSLCADASLLTRLTQSMMHQEQVTPADLADAATELFNVLCGHVVVELYQATHLKIRFQIPQFSPGYSIPENRMHLFTLNYRSNKDESIQVIHHIPLSLCKTGGEHLERRYMT